MFIYNYRISPMKIKVIYLLFLTNTYD